MMRFDCRSLEELKETVKLVTDDGDRIAIYVGVPWNDGMGYTKALIPYIFRVNKGHFELIFREEDE